MSIKNKILHNSTKQKQQQVIAIKKLRSAWSARVHFPVDFGHWIKPLIFAKFSTDSERD